MIPQQPHKRPTEGVQRHHHAGPIAKARDPFEEAQSSGSYQDLQKHLLDRLLQLREHPDWERVWNRLKTTVVRGAAAGLSIRGGLHLLSTLLWLLRTSTSRKKARGKEVQRTLSGGEALLDTLRYTLFLASLGGSFVAVDEGLAILLGKDKTKAWRSLVAGAIAGHTVLLTGPRARHHSLATYVLLRGLTLLVRCGNKSAVTAQSSGNPQSLLHRLLGPTRWTHGDVVLMCLASSQIVYSYIMMPGTLPPSYIRFLNKQAAKEQFVWNAVREQALNNWRRVPPGPLAPLRGTQWQTCRDHTPCSFWHPGQGCVQHAVSIVPHSYLRALGVYLPVYLVPALLVHRQKLLSQPKVLLPKLMLGMSRSALFLTSFIALAFAGACGGFNLTGSNTGPIIAASTAVGGVAILLEKKSRRMELALYCLSRALESFARCLQSWGMVPHGLLPARTDVLLFSAGCAAIMHCYSDSCGAHRDVFRSKYLNVLDFVFGNTGVGQGEISHHPSNLDLLRTATRSFTSWSSGRLQDAAHSASTPDLEHTGQQGGHAQHAQPTHRAWSSTQLHSSHTHSHVSHSQTPLLTPGHNGTHMQPVTPRLHDPSTSNGGAAGPQPTATGTSSDWEQASQPAFHSMRFSLISQAAASSSSSLHVMQHRGSVGNGSAASLAAVAHDSGWSQSLSHLAQHRGHTSVTQLDEHIVVTPLSSGSSSSSGGAPAPLPLLERLMVDTHNRRGSNGGSAPSASATLATVVSHTTAKPQKRMSASNLSVGPGIVTVRSGATASAAASVPAAAAPTPAPAPACVSGARVSRSQQPDGAALRRIATAPCIQSLVQLASMDESDADDEDGEARVHGGSDRQEHMVHYGQCYTSHDTRPVQLLSNSHASAPVSIPSKPGPVAHHHSNGSAGSDVQMGSPAGSSPLSHSLGVGGGAGLGARASESKQHGSSLLFGVRSLGRISSRTTPTLPPPAFASSLAACTTSTHVHASTGSRNGYAAFDASGLPRAAALSMQGPVRGSVRMVGSHSAGAAVTTTTTTTTAVQAGSRLQSHAGSAASSAGVACMLPLGSPFSGSPPDAPSPLAEHAHLHGHHRQPAHARSAVGSLPSATGRAATAAGTAGGEHSTMHHPDHLPEMGGLPETKVHGSGRGLGGAHGPGGMQLATSSSPSTSATSHQQQGSATAGVPLPPISQRDNTTAVGAGPSNQGNSISISGSSGGLTAAVAGAPAFTSTLLGWSSGRLQYVSTSPNAAPAPINVVHASGETTVIPPEDVLAAATAPGTTATSSTSATTTTDAQQEPGSSMVSTAAGLRHSSSSEVESTVGITFSSSSTASSQMALSDVSFRSWSNFHSPTVTSSLAGSTHGNAAMGSARSGSHAAVSNTDGPTEGTGGGLHRGPDGAAPAAVPSVHSMLSTIMEAVSGAASGAESDAAVSTDQEGATLQGLRPVGPVTSRAVGSPSNTQQWSEDRAVDGMENEGNDLAAALVNEVAQPAPQSAAGNYVDGVEGSEAVISRAHIAAGHSRLAQDTAAAGEGSTHTPAPASRQAAVVSNGSSSGPNNGPSSSKSARGGAASGSGARKGKKKGRGKGR